MGRFSVKKFERIDNFGNCELVVMQMKNDTSGFELVTPLRYLDCPTGGDDSNSDGNISIGEDDDYDYYDGHNDDDDDDPPS